MKKLWQDMIDLLKAPLSGELDTIHIFLITGVVILAAVIWFIILDHIRKAASEV